MKKCYLKPIVHMFVLAMFCSFIVFGVLSLIIDPKPDLSRYDLSILAISFYISITTVGVVLVMEIPSFLVFFDDFGISKGLLRKEIRWCDVEEVKVDGFRGVKESNTVNFISSKLTISVSLFVFKDQSEVLMEIKRNLPWAASLDLGRLPSEVRKV